MISRCENCGQTIMATDSQCWHCGKALSPNKPNAVRRPQLTTAVPDDTQPPPPPIQTILLYVGLTAVTLLILIATTRAIGKAPLFLVSGSTTPLVGWQPITDSELQFTLNLPEAWQTVELNHAPEAPGLRSSPPVYVLVAQSQRLQRLSPDEIVRYAQQQLSENVIMVETTLPDDPAETNRGNLLFY
jgi:hypothetical protein